MRNEEEWITIDALVGSIVLPPKQRGVFFKTIFDEGVKWKERNPKGKIVKGKYFILARNNYTKAYQKAVRKSLKALNKANKNKFKSGGCSAKDNVA